jgi:hypothetical protein
VVWEEDVVGRRRCGADLVLTSVEVGRRRCVGTRQKEPNVVENEAGDRSGSR